MSAHRSRNIGLRLVLLVIHAVIDGRFYKLKPITKHRQNFLIFFNIFCIIKNYTNDQLVRQHYNQLAGSVTENVSKLSLASERMQAVERSQLRSQSVFKQLQPSARCCEVDHGFDHFSPVPYAGY